LGAVVDRAVVPELQAFGKSVFDLPHHFSGVGSDVGGGIGSSGGGGCSSGYGRSSGGSRLPVTVESTQPVSERAGSQPVLGSAPPERRARISRFFVLF